MTTECRSIGVVSTDKVNAFVGLLRGVCTSFRAIQLQEVLLKVPLQGGASTVDFRLVRFVDPTADRWLVRCESAPNKGPVFQALPAAIRNIDETSCWGNNTPDFWIALGAKVDYEVVKKGHEYICMYQGYELKAHVYMIYTKKDGKDLSAQPNNKLYVVEVTAVVPEASAIEAAKAIGAFGQQLVPFVELRRAAIF